MDIIEKLQAAHTAFLNLLPNHALYDMDGNEIVRGGFWVDIEDPTFLQEVITEILELRSKILAQQAEMELNRIDVIEANEDLDRARQITCDEWDRLKKRQASREDWVDTYMRNTKPDPRWFWANNT